VRSSVAEGRSGRGWLDAEPKHVVVLRGNVTLLESRTLGCYNCRNVEPHVKEWPKKYADRGRCETLLGEL